MTKLTATTTAVVLVVGMAACGDDDSSDDAADDTPQTTVAGTETDTGTGGETDDAAEGDAAAFCDALIEFNGAVFSIELDDSSTPEQVEEVGAELAPLFATIVENAPSDVADQAAELDSAVSALAEGDASAFNSDATFEAYGAFVEDSVGACDLTEVEVTGIDYGFEAPASIPAGNVSFAFTNASDVEEHEMVLMRKADGVEASWDELLQLPEEEAMSQTEFVGAAFAPPSGAMTTMASLETGDYAMLCFIPIGGAEDGAPHFTAGMVHEFTVE